jgi:hypothetical protein
MVQAPSHLVCLLHHPRIDLHLLHLLQIDRRRLRHLEAKPLMLLPPLCRRLLNHQRPRQSSLLTFAAQ